MTFNISSCLGSIIFGGEMMILKPDEVTYLKKGKKVLVEIKEGDVRTLKGTFAACMSYTKTVIL